MNFFINSISKRGINILINTNDIIIQFDKNILNTDEYLLLLHKSGLELISNTLENNNITLYVNKPNNFKISTLYNNYNYLFE